MGNIGFRVYMSFERLPRTVVDGFKEIATPNIGDSMGRFYAMHPRVKNIGRPGSKLVGSALTVKAAPGDNLMVHKAIDIAQEGDVIVVATGGDLSHSMLGEIMCRLAALRGIRGFVLDGAVRDVAAIRELGFPVFAAGSTPGGPYKNGPGEINVPVSCGGVVVNPGDVVVGDDDGVMIIPRQEAEEVLAKAQALAEKERQILADLERGLSGDRSWVDKLLVERGCEIIE
ncbi:MAG: RraA family protein [Firmicutes bacterium]|nr:RraA family protein [Bacillota bacterium]